MPNHQADEDVAASLHHVVVNHEEQYSVWPADRQPPAGWTTVGPARSKDDCLDHIAEVWTDMRPLSLRQRMDNA
ncbi:MbtH family NRPS accessory protein [Micromonospora sp. NPDC047467]|uniref:MbtH family protein n=1 Tax=Micromonospora sp. NPDC047467 TaxID=3154814 RepID=UPI00340D755D